MVEVEVEMSDVEAVLVVEVEMSDVEVEMSDVEAVLVVEVEMSDVEGVLVV